MHWCDMRQDPTGIRTQAHAIHGNNSTLCKKCNNTLCIRPPPKLGASWYTHIHVIISWQAHCDRWGYQAYKQRACGVRGVYAVCGSEGAVILYSEYVEYYNITSQKALYDMPWRWHIKLHDIGDSITNV